METAKQAMNRHELAKQFAVDLESKCVDLLLKQGAHWNQVYEPTSIKLQKFLCPESPQTDGVSVEWKTEYNNMRHPIDALRREAVQQSEHATGLSRHDPFDDLLARPSINPSKPAPGWTRDWAALRVSCERLETERSEFMKRLLSAYADALSTIRLAENEVGFLLISTCLQLTPFITSPLKPSTYLSTCSVHRTLLMTLFKSLEETKLLLTTLACRQPHPFARRRGLQHHLPPLFPRFLCRLLAGEASQSGDHEVRYYRSAFYD